MKVLVTREDIASEIEAITIGEILLAAGEMTAQERRTAKAVRDYIAFRVRTATEAGAPVKGDRNDQRASQK